MEVVAEDIASRRLSVRGDLAALHRAFGVSLEAVSMDGTRWATGTDEPASMGNFSSFEISTMRRALLRVSIKIQRLQNSNGI